MNRMPPTDLNLRAAFPEIHAGGFSRCDGTIDFYGRVNALAKSDSIVLDFGAGRGSQLLDDPNAWRTTLSRLQGRVGKLVGIDVDEAVMDNPFLDEAYDFEPSEQLPFEAETFDLIYSDWVIEHVEDPIHFAREAYRVLKPGGWFCARTPNRWGITGIGANLVPNRMHTRFLKHLQPQRLAQDTFTTIYRMNTRGQIRRAFASADWQDFSYFHNPEPPYVQRSRFLIELFRFLFRFAPPVVSTNLHIFLRKKADGDYAAGVSD